MNWYTKISAKEDRSVESYLARLGVREDVISYITTLNPQLKQQAVGYLSKNPHTDVNTLMQQFRTPLEQKQNSNTPEEMQLVSRYNNMEFQQWALVQMRKIRMAFSLRPEKPFDPRNPIRQEDLIQGQTSYNLHNISLILNEVFDWYSRGIIPARQAMSQATTPEEKIHVTNEYGVDNINTNLASLDLESAKELSDEWHEVISGKGNGLSYFGEKKEDIVYGPQWKDPANNGWTIKSVKTRNNLMTEGNQVGHCVGGYCDDVEKGNTRIFSLRDPNNVPYVTMEVEPNSWNFSQIFGNGPKTGNADPSPKLKLMLGEWIKTLPGAIIPGMGDFDYNLSYSEMDEDLQQAIYGSNEYGIEPNLIDWDYEDAYNVVNKKLSNDRSYRNNGGHMASRVAPILANAAFDSDIQKLKLKKFNPETIKQKALTLALRSRKNPSMKYDPNKIDNIKHFLEPYFPRAEKSVKEDLNYIGVLQTITPERLQSRINDKAFALMQEDKEFDSTKLKKLEDLDPTNQRKFVAMAIDSMSQISRAYKLRQENEEDLFTSYDYSYDYNEPEPDVDDFENDDEYQVALREWENNREQAEAEAMDEYKKNTLPYCLDESIIEDIERLIIKENFKLPLWMTKYFGKGAGDAPYIMWAIQRAKIRKKEEDAKYGIPLRKKKSSGWYNTIKLSEEYLKNILSQKSFNNDIIIDSDLNGIDFKEDGDLIRIEAYDKKKGFVIGHLNYYTQGNTLQIEMIEVGEDYKRQGIATQLIEKMKQDHPGFRVEPGLITHQGQPFFKNLKQKKII